MALLPHSLPRLPFFFFLARCVFFRSSAPINVWAPTRFFFERILILPSLGFHWVAFRPFTHYASRFLDLLFGLIALQIGPSILVSNFFLLFLKEKKKK